MPEMTLGKDAAGYGILNLSRRALKALSSIEGLSGGALSPLARMQAPEGAADARSLVAAWEPLDDTWKWAVPALIDPHHTIALVLGDGNTNAVGQYLFPDAEAYGPGFHLDVGGESASLTGPVSLGILQVGIYSHLAFEEVVELEPFRADLSPDHFWVLAACLDAFRAAILERRIQRVGGAPAGVGPTEISKAWTDGISIINPGWVVSLFSLLVPASVPRDLPQRLPDLLKQMSRQGLLQELKGPVYAFPESLSPLLWGPTMTLNFGLVRQRLAQPELVESTILGGWRMPGGIWLADLSDIENSGVSLVLGGPTLATEIIDDLLGDDSLAPSWDAFSLETSYSRDVIVSQLSQLSHREESVASASGTSIGETEKLTCSACGKELKADLNFCNACGTPVPQRGFCNWCGNRLLQGARFCRKCGKRV